MNELLKSLKKLTKNSTNPQLVEEAFAFAEKVYNDKFNLKMDKFALIRLYDRIEKRGFRVNINGVDVRCLNNVIFVSEIQTVS